MGYGRFSSDTFAARTTRTMESGSATSAGEQRQKEGKGLHDLVDPSRYGVIRPSRNRYVEVDGGLWQLYHGPKIGIESLLDTTGSMGGNVALAMGCLPSLYGMLSGEKNALLGRYDIDIATSVFGDMSDKYVLQRSQFEMTDEKIHEQMTCMYPEKGGGDADEDPQYGIFAAAYLTNSMIARVYGLKWYHFTISDACGRSYIDANTLKRVFGDDVFKILAEDGQQISQRNLPDTAQVVQDLLKSAHGFFLQVGDNASTTRFWRSLYGKERVILLPETQYLPHIQAAVIGLTEATLDLQSVQEFLCSEGMPKVMARDVSRALSGIPLGAQAALPNFNKIPKRGDLFKNKGDAWPVDASELPAAGSTLSDTTVGAWKL